MRRQLKSIACIGLLTLAIPSVVGAWGANAHRLITNKAFETLPAEMRGFYESNKVRMLSMVTDPLDTLAKNPAEKKYHVLYLNRYSPFPFDSLPRNYKKAVAKFGQSKIEANGVLPWQIGVYNEKLTDAFRKNNWDEVRQYSTLLAHYVAEAHDPFNTADITETRSSLAGADERFDTNLVDRYSLFFPMRPNDAHYIGDPTDSAFEDCFSAHSWLQIILLADRRARAGLPDFTDEYYDRFYNQAGAIVIRQLSDAATEVGSYWLTAWTNAGKPALPQH